jgi:hypothetical protein
LTGGLAWAGLIIILAVPSADMLTRGSGSGAAMMTSDMDAVETASVAPAAQIEAPRVVVARPGEEPVIIDATTDDPVEEYLNSGKKLPSYISDAPEAVASGEPAPVTRLVAPSADAPDASPDASQPSVAVAAVESRQPAASLTAPLPYPASMRPVPTAAPATAALAPAAPAALAPVTTASLAPPATATGKGPVATNDEDVVAEDENVVTDDEDVVIVDEDLVARREAAVAAVLGEDPIEPEEPFFLDDGDLEEWDSGSLADYLERRGLISDGEDEAWSDFDEDGFFLDEGPNADGARRRLRREFIFF